MWKFTIIDNTTGGTVTVIDEPVGWDGITMRFKRESTWHGFFELLDEEITTLQFDNIGYGILTTAFEIYGIEADVMLSIEYLCSGTTYDELWTGRFDFPRYKAVCGDRCYVEITVMANTCMMKMRNRTDQKVDLGTATAFDGATALPPYGFLGFDMELPPVQVTLASKGTLMEPESTPMLDGGSTNTSGTFYSQYTPELAITLDEMPLFIGSEALLIPPPDTSIGISPLHVYEFEGSPLCGTEQLAIDVHFKGRLFDNSFSDRTIDLWLFVAYGPPGAFANRPAGPPPWPDAEVVKYNSVAPHDDAFDYNWSGVITLTPGQQVFIFFELNISKLDGLTYAPTLELEEGSIKLTSTTVCDSSTAEVYMVNETLSRVTEAITDDCLRVYSDYFGRTDAEPYASLANGCGSRSVLTNGLKIRNAEMEDGTEPKFTVSLKDLFNGLNAIHNIGMGLEPDPARPGYDLLRMERYPYFYQDTVVFTASDVAELEIEVQEESYISTFKIGYAKWETESVNGRHDIHTKREYRTGLATVANTYDRECGFIASGLTIEVTRRAFSKTTKDFKYDNDTFIINVRPAGSPPYYQVEVAGGGMAYSHIPGGDTMYNMAISPARNAMRHLNTVLQSYVDTTGKLFFTEGQGNLVGESLRNVGTFCRIEDQTVKENTDIDLTLFADPDTYLPVHTNELARFDYPMSYQEFKNIKANPYGLIQFNCYNGPVRTGWIENMRYAPEDGIASFEVKPKHPQAA